jgi:hypothetical protein
VKRMLVVLIAACGGSKAPPPQQPVVSNSATTTPPPVTPSLPELPGLDASVCEQRNGGFGPVPLTDVQAPKRRGETVTSYADAVNSQAKPIEVCGVGAEFRWLANVHCNGDVALKNPPERAGSVGGGGACDSIIDLYEVKCPEKTYKVYMDMYMCGPNVKFR